VLLAEGAKDEEIFAALASADALPVNGPNPEVKS
jgi:hypothetical protein